MTMKVRHSVHPFPARMAPELAFESLRHLRRDSVVLDPMSGSGTVLRQASDLGLSAIGFDMDPLAVLMARVWTTPINDTTAAELSAFILSEARSLRKKDIYLEWIDNDEETKEFVEFWFGRKQLRELRSIAFVMNALAMDAETSATPELDAMRISLSRIIITKEQCASLARDTSHSRPHRVSSDSDYCCYSGFERSAKAVRARLMQNPPKCGARVKLGDARSLKIKANSADAILTSPPYLNAIDYMRGHRLSLVWLGHRLSALRAIRSNTIGAERGPDAQNEIVPHGRKQMGAVELLPARYGKMIDRYILDVYRMMSEMKRVLRPGGTATLVVGNSCLRSVFLSNSNLVHHAALAAGFKLKNSTERPLPDGSRYLPTNVAGSLGKRMRTETVLTLAV
jgi:DNA modification methylase